MCVFWVTFPKNVKSLHFQWTLIFAKWQVKYCISTKFTRGYGSNMSLEIHSFWFVTSWNCLQHPHSLSFLDSGRNQFFPHTWVGALEPIKNHIYLKTVSMTPWYTFQNLREKQLLSKGFDGCFCLNYEITNTKYCTCEKNEVLFIYLLKYCFIKNT